ncbi:MAG TPA: formate dehydrogenase accessory protein FdhE, partial [Verrucomicrobiae bacterium]|nr:formate dehydrogenase accessory protein FdhE [Verrucomicrobiae bacterium]
MDHSKQDLKLQNKQMDTARENYLRLKKEINLWHEEKGPIWADSLQAASSFPLFTLDSLPQEAVIELWQRLNKAAGKEVNGETLQNLWDEFKAGSSIPEHTLLSCLHLALAGVAQLFRLKLGLEDSGEDQPFGPCPVCGEEGAIATLVPPVGKRFLHCIICGHDRPVKATGCIQCGSEQPDRQ